MTGWVPRPRVGQRVRLRSGAEATVISSRRARDILIMLPEIEAASLTAECLGRFGSNWIDLYYEVDVVTDVPDGTRAVSTVTTTEVDSVIA